MAKLNPVEEALIRKGYVKDEKGNYKPPPSGRVMIIPPGAPDDLTKKDLLKMLDNMGPMEFRPIVETPEFTRLPSTEWFIKNYNVPSKKNSRQTFVSKNGKQVNIPSKIHAEYVKMTAMQYKVFGIEFRQAVQYYNLSYPLRIQFTFIRSSQRRFDFCNACQTCEDLMVKNEWIEDDSADHIVPVFAPYEYNKNEFGVKIKILM